MLGFDAPQLFSLFGPAKAGAVVVAIIATVIIAAATKAVTKRRTILRLAVTAMRAFLLSPRLHCALPSCSLLFRWAIRKQKQSRVT